MSAPPMAMVSAALGYARRGWPVFPVHSVTDGRCTCGADTCSSPGKHPATAHGLKDATTDDDAIGAWWANVPEANIGLATGNGLVVLDIDNHAADGFASVRFLAEELGELPETAAVVTGSGGEHWYYAVPPGLRLPNSAGKLGPGIDVRGDGGYVVAPPSVHATGRRYTWVKENADIAELPPAWRTRLLSYSARTFADATNMRPFEGAEGSGRNDRLTSLAGKLRAQGDAADAIFDVLRARNARFKDPLPERDVERIANGITRYPPKLNTSKASEGDGITAPDGTPNPGALIPQLAEKLLANRAFAQDAGGKLWHYELGSYRPGGDETVAQLVRLELLRLGLAKWWRPERGKAVAEWIRLAPAPRLAERPPVDIVNVRNGLLDLRTGALRPHTPAHLSPIQLPVTYTPGATCPAWERFIADTFPPDAHELAWEIVAFLVDAGLTIQKAVLLIGEGSNGKSVFLSGLTAFIGEENATNVPLQKLEEDRFSVARLIGKLANISADLPGDDIRSTSIFKAVTGGDRLAAEYKYRDQFEYRPFARMLFSANHYPKSADASQAFFRRWVVLPFERTFEGDAATPRSVLDVALADSAELSGLLNKALAVLPRLRERGFSQPASVADALAEFRSSTDPIAVWLDANTVTHSAAYVRKDALYQAYVAAAEEKGFARTSPHAFTKQVQRLRKNAREAFKRLGGENVRVWQGLGLVGQTSGDDTSFSSAGREGDTTFSSRPAPATPAAQKETPGFSEITRVSRDSRVSDDPTDTPDTTFSLLLRGKKEEDVRRESRHKEEERPKDREKTCVRGGSSVGPETAVETGPSAGTYNRTIAPATVARTEPVGGVDGWPGAADSGDADAAMGRAPVGGAGDVVGAGDDAGAFGTTGLPAHGADAGPNGDGPGAGVGGAARPGDAGVDRAGPAVRPGLAPDAAGARAGGSVGGGSLPPCTRLSCRREAVEVDEDLGPWCAEHMDRLQLLNAAYVLDWPSVSASGHGRIGGVAAWRAFARAAPDRAVEAAGLALNPPVPVCAMPGCGGPGDRIFQGSPRCAAHMTREIPT